MGESAARQPARPACPRAHTRRVIDVSAIDPVSDRLAILGIDTITGYCCCALRDVGCAYIPIINTIDSLTLDYSPLAQSREMNEFSMDGRGRIRAGSPVGPRATVCDITWCNADCGLARRGVARRTSQEAGSTRHASHAVGGVVSMSRRTTDHPRNCPQCSIMFIHMLESIY